MSHPDSPPHGMQTASHDTPPAAGPLPFSESQWQTLQAEDVHAARAVVGLMLSIFTIGLFLYTIVCFSVAF